MSPFTPRPYTGLADLEAATRLIAARPPARAADFPAIADLQEMLGTDEVRARTWLWHDDTGRFAGFTILEAGESEASLVFEAAPWANGLPERMIAWAIDGLRRATRPGQSVTLSVGCREDDAARRALLQARGFVCQPTHTLHMARPLDEPIPEPRRPDGFTIQHGAGADQAEAWVALHRAAFGTEYMTVDYRLAMIAAPAYDPALDLVAVAPDGAFAAYVMASVSDDENAVSGRKDGFTDPVATHPAYQQRGLARALLLAALRLLRERGMDTAHLGTASDNVAMQRAAMAVGYRVESKTLFFVREIGAAG